MSSLVPYFISGGGFAGLMVVLFVTGRIHPHSIIEMKDKQLEAQQRKIDELETALALERARSDVGVTVGITAASVAKDVMEALRKEAR